MDIELIIKSVVGLVVILGILMFLLLYKPKEKIKKKKQVNKIEKKVQSKKDIDLQTLRGMIKNKNSSTKDLDYAVDEILKHFGSITKKIGIRTHPDFDIYNEMLFMLSKHKNANKNIILRFNRELEKRNPQYKNEINDAVSRGLNARV